MKSIWIIAVVLAFVAGSIMASGMAYAAGEKNGQPFEALWTAIHEIELTPGEPGDDGEDGADGEDGEDGAKGDKGDTGPSGVINKDIIINSGIFTAGDGGTVVTFCPLGTKLTGGGYRVAKANDALDQSLSVIVYQSAPSAIGNSWAVNIKNTSDESVLLTVRAICVS